MRESDQCFTPEHIFKTLRIKFDLDVAAPPGGVSWIPAKRFLTEAEDGLATPWRGRVWMNPPFSQMSPWVDKFIEHGNGIALLPFAKSNWLDRLWASDAGFCLLREHNCFIKNGKPHSIFMRVCLVAMGRASITAISRIGPVR